MSMKGLLAEECGGPNPLMRLASKVRAGNIQQQEIGIRQLEDDTLQSQTDFEEHFPMSQTFDMQCLLDEMNHIERPTDVENVNVLSNKMARNWENEYLSLKNDSVENFSHQNMASYSHQNSTPSMYTPRFFIAPPISRQPMLLHNETTKLAHEYLDDVETAESSAILKTGQEIISAFEEGEELKSKEDGRLAEKWVREYENAGNDDVLAFHKEMSKEIESDVAYWEKLQGEWNELFQEQRFQNDQDVSLTGFEQEYKQEYKLEEDNPFNGLDGAFEKGIIKLNEGDLISAILLFEEAVRAKPDHAEAWQYLGTSQAENEQDLLAIRALNKCVELQPDNLTARMNLAVSYTNEYLQVQAYDALKSWIKCNPTYSHLVTDISTISDSNLGSSMMSKAMFEELQSLYLAAARISPEGDIDTDVQIGLGVLYNLSGDYQKAIDCFETGLKASPDSATLWNKLGATFANSGRPADAMAAYRNALGLRPGFIRCRYNIGISCVSMNAYTEAVEHFLSALAMQRKGEDPSRAASTMSESIWSTLRMTISMLGRLDLMRAVDQRDLHVLSNEFNIHNSPS